MGETKPKRRWFQYSLRTFLVAITVLAVWLGVKINAARRQHEAVTAILKAGGSIAYSYQATTDPDGLIKIDPHASPHVPSWLRNWLGDDFLFEVVEASFLGNGRTIPARPIVITESDLSQLAKLPGLRSVTFGNVNIAASDTHPQRLLDDSDLTVLRNLSRLENLGVFPAEVHGNGLANITRSNGLKSLLLIDTPIDDLAIGHISKLTNLQYLWLRNTRISDRGLENLRSMPSLEYLNLDKNSINGTGLRFLNSPNLETIYLRQTLVDGQGLAVISKFPSLWALTLSGCEHLDGPGLAQLEKSQNLERLELNLTNLSDADLPYLTRLKQLKNLDFDWNDFSLSDDMQRLRESYRLTADGIEELRIQLPNVVIKQ